MSSKARNVRSRSVFRTIMLPLLALVAVEILFLIASLQFSGVIQRLNQNAEDILRTQVQNRKSYLENAMVTNWSELSLLAEKINSTTQDMLDRGLLTLEELDQNSDACTPLLLNITDELISNLYAKKVSGIFVVFDTHGLEGTGAQGGVQSRPGIYLRDLDPQSPPSIRNGDLLLERAPIALVRSMNISTDAVWQPLFSISQEENNFFITQPLQAARAAPTIDDASDYGYWTTSPYAIQGSVHQSVSYSIPLVLSDGTVYGVLGIDLITDYLCNTLPFGELSENMQGAYLLAVTQGDSSDPLFSPVLINGPVQSLLSEQQSVRLHPRAGGGYTFELDGKRYYAQVEYLPLYNSNTPFIQQRWAIIGTVPERVLFAFSSQVTNTLYLVVFCTLLAGIIGSLIVSRRLSRPIRTLFHEVNQAQRNQDGIPQLSKTGIQEIDSFSQAFTDLSREVLDASTKFLRIMEMASVDMGGFELRQEDDSVFVTDNFFPLFERRDVDPSALTAGHFHQLMDDIYRTTQYTNSADGSWLSKVELPQGGVRYLRLEVTQDQTRYVGVVEDVTAATLERLRIEHERDYDLLTGLYNRRALYRLVEALFCTPSKLGHAALVMLDLDNLKSTNDRFGHDCGDQYIRQAGQCFATSVPSGTLCSRVSGDEFYLFFYGYDSREQVRAALDSLSQAIRTSVFSLPNGEKTTISASGGVAWYPDDSTQFRALMKYADFAMYQMKQTRKGQLGDFDLGVYNRESFLLQSRSAFLRMIKEELLTYHFQPILDAKTGAVHAYEALMRVNLPPLRAPDTVLSLARQEGRLQDIERLTWYKSLESYQALLDRGQADPKAMLFVNSIASQCLSQEDWNTLSQQYPALISRIVTEITESESMDSEATLRKRSALGFSQLFALDDYGSGYNSEKTLLTLSPKYIKVDLSIVRGIDTDQDKQQLVSNIVDYAHKRGMYIITEGLETVQEIQTVVELDVDLLQGFYLARPGAVPPQIAPSALALLQSLQASRRAAPSQ